MARYFTKCEGMNGKIRIVDKKRHFTQNEISDVVVAQSYKLPLPAHVASTAT